MIVVDHNLCSQISTLTFTLNTFLFLLLLLFYFENKTIFDEEKNKPFRLEAKVKEKR